MDLTKMLDEYDPNGEGARLDIPEDGKSEPTIAVRMPKGSIARLVISMPGRQDEVVFEHRGSDLWFEYEDVGDVRHYKATFLVKMIRYQPIWP